jgi:hypothetical protein
MLLEVSTEFGLSRLQAAIAAGQARDRGRQQLVT